MEMNVILTHLHYVGAEVILFATSILALLYGLFARESHVKFIVLCGMLFAIMELFHIDYRPIEIFNGSILMDNITKSFRFIILFSSLLSVLFIYRSEMKFEIPILITISTMSLMLMVASNDLMTMYLTMELSALTMYICVASNKNSYISTEAGLKYFILGSVSSGIFLFGVSILSGFSGSFSFDYISSCMVKNSLPILFIFSVFLVLIVFLFKMSVVPFHGWLADVYHGAPVYGSLFIGSTSKIAICGLFVRFVYSLFDNLNIELQTILIVVAVLSMFVGSIVAMMQEDLRRILAYSSIGNMGFAVAAIATGSSNGIASGFVYIVLYSLLMFIPAFVLITLLASAKHRDDPSILLSDLRELSISNPYKTGALALIMFSTAGLPPFAGFFGKFFILMSIIAQEMEILLIFFVIGAILSSVYCIKIIKSIYFISIDFKSVIPTTSLQCRFEVILVSIICLANTIYCLYASAAVTFFSSMFRDLL